MSSVDSGLHELIFSSITDVRVKYYFLCPRKIAMFGSIANKGGK